MSTNDFLPVAIDAGNNAEAQASYAGSDQQLKGWLDDSSPPANRWNKMLRQATCVAAILAQVICNVTGGDMLDNGDQAAKITALQGMFRIRLTAATTFYVSVAGSDVTGDGTVGNPWRTGQHAVDTLMAKYDFAYNGVTISRVDSNAYTDPVIVTGRFVSQAGPLVFTASASANVTVTVSTAAYCYESFAGAFIRVENQKLINSIGGALYASQESILHHSGCNFGACSGTTISADRNSLILALGAHTISGGAQVFAGADNSSSIELGASLITFSGTPAFSLAFVEVADRGGINAIGTTFAGTFTGKRYQGVTGGGFNTGGGGAGFFPGTIAGTVDAATYSWYV